MAVGSGRNAKETMSEGSTSRNRMELENEKNMRYNGVYMHVIDQGSSFNSL